MGRPCMAKHVERSIDRYYEKRPRGWPLIRWRDSVREIQEEFVPDWEQAYDRERWKEIVLMVKCLNGS